MRKIRLLLGILLALNAIMVLANVCYGSVTIPFDEIGMERWQYIIWQMRFPAALTAMLTGAALGAAGLLLQSYFRNPLAGPSILGITSGANLMVVLLTMGNVGIGLSSPIATIGATVTAAFIGAGGVLLLLLLMGRYVRNQTTLLIVGMMLSYLTSAIITLLGYRASQQGLQQMMLWGMGDFGSVGMSGLPYYILFIIIGVGGSLCLIKPMNGWMMGELYAQNMGINLKTTRWMVLGVTGLLSAITTAWCGPIAFVGLSMPHAARLLLKTDDHRLLLPTTMLLGALCCSLCLRLSTTAEGGTLLPINALTPIFGIPIIVYVLTKTDKNT